eukprot:CAMPEP_0196726776 /NCGR_PEP_ID=MMETSP1091-20130531/7951_1 /TAXON_ID=302021 /ORGANISM="Rhodomonas sp., Strain CCMP768" /LENGTH=112 /DNA_ID=CAMNT_0042069263 /DNA_START=18 /DNA_END=357 /DNA_ORIENTATION=-
MTTINQHLFAHLSWEETDSVIIEPVSFLEQSSRKASSEKDFPLAANDVSGGKEVEPVGLENLVEKTISCPSAQSGWQMATDLREENTIALLVRAMGACVDSQPTAFECARNQ